MDTRMFPVLLVVAAVPLFTFAQSYPDAQALQKLNRRFAQVDLGADVSKLPQEERLALVKMLEAARVMEPLFIRQVWSGNESLLTELLDDRTPLGRARLDAFLLHKGPWDRLEGNRPFIPGVPSKPPQANFYSATEKREIEAWFDSLGEKDHARATSFFTTVRREPGGKFVALPYSIEYQGELRRASELLREAAELTRQPSLKRYLQTRAEAFLSNDYYPSDVAWLELDSSIEPTIGPYEVYEDEWFNQKAAFEAFITVRDDEETRKLEQLSQELQGLENQLPIEPKYRNPKLEGVAPIRVVNAIFSSGDAGGIQTASFTLPLDEKTARENGVKRVFLKNVQRAKFEKVLMPIARAALAREHQAHVDFDAFFTYMLLHELTHGVGPRNAQVEGKTLPLRQIFQEEHSTLEEAKANVTGLWALQVLVDKGVLSKRVRETIPDTFVASSLRSMRFGINDAHGKAVALQLNYLLDAGAVSVRKDGAFAIEEEKFRKAVADLAREILTIQATGDRTRGLTLIRRLAVLRPEVKRIFAKVRDVPVDIWPKFVTADQLLNDARMKQLRTQR